MALKADGRVAVVTIPYPSMSRDFVAWLDSVTGQLMQEETIGAIVFTGARGVFLTGADLSEVRMLQDRSKVEDFLHLPHRLMKRIYAVEKLTVAAINGHCLGGGLELALVCDFRMAADNLRGGDGEPLAYIGLPEVRLGLVPALGGARRLIETVGLGVARQMLYAGELVTAARAMQIGLVDSLAAQTEICSQAVSYCEKLLGASPIALRAIKRLVRSAVETGGFEIALTEAGDAFADCCRAADKNERIRAYHRASVNNFRSAAN